jgi:hypothetical protein
MQTRTLPTVLPCEDEWRDAEKLRAVAKSVTRFANDLDHGRHPSIAKLLTAFKGLADCLRPRLEGDDEQRRLESAESVIPQEDGPVGAWSFRLRGKPLDLQPRELLVLKLLWAEHLAGRGTLGIHEDDLNQMLYGELAPPNAVRSTVKSLTSSLIAQRVFDVRVYWRRKRLRILLEDD